LLEEMEVITDIQRQWQLSWGCKENQTLSSYLSQATSCSQKRHIANWNMHNFRSDAWNSGYHYCK